MPSAMFGTVSASNSEVLEHHADAEPAGEGRVAMWTGSPRQRSRPDRAAARHR
jgi:hypothetical protein